VAAVPDVAEAGARPGEAGATGAETATTDGSLAADAALEGSAAAPEVLLDAGGEAATVAGDAELPADEEVAGGNPAEGDGGNRERGRIAKNLVQQGMAALSGRRFAEARDAFTRALLIDPRAHGARLGLGRVSFQQGQFEDAVRYLEPAYRNQGNMELGIAYVRVGRTADAKQQFERVLARDPNNAAAQRALQSLR
jgi:tetratricopeptide (TPR) repeat protein